MALRDVVNGVLSGSKAARLGAADVAAAYNEGLRAAYRAIDPRSRRVWVTERDDSVCPLCSPLDGVISDSNDVFPGGAEPGDVHLYCRCWGAPQAAEAATGTGADLDPEFVERLTRL